MIQRFAPAMALCVAFAFACKKEDETTESAKPSTEAQTPVEPPKPDPVALPPAPPLPKTPLGLPELSVPPENPLTAEKVHLGKMLFFDPRLSADGSMACVTCHLPDKAWTDGRQFAPKVGGAVNTRNAPTLVNVGYYTSFYWDGRAPTLEANVLAAWKGNMGADPDAIARALTANATYKAEFQRAFGADPTGDSIVKALASFVRTIRSGNSAWDRYEKGDKSAVSEDAIKGYGLFTGKAQCSLCHAPPLYYDTLFHNIGVGPADDIGRAKVTNDKKETGAFKTPGLRDVTKTGPYFHDGSVATLEEAVKLMLAGGKKNKHLDEKLKTIKLSDGELGQLMAFLKSLEGEVPFEEPTLPE